MRIVRKTNRLKYFLATLLLLAPMFVSIGLFTDNVNALRPAPGPTTQNIKVSVKVTGIPLSVTAETIGPVTLNLLSRPDPNGTVLQPTITNQDINGGKTTSVTLKGTFQNIAPGNYKICSPDLTNVPCVNINANQFNGPIAVALTGQSTSGVINSGTCSAAAPQGCDSQCVTSVSVGWFLCGIFDSVGKACDFIFQNVFQPFLKPPTISFNPNNQVYKVWSTFRLYGNIFLVIALLVVVFAEATGGGIVDAYSARKILPRLLAAAVLINLSIYIVAALVDITSVIGGGLGALIVPSGAKGAFAFNLSGAQVGAIYTLTAGGGIAVTILALVMSAGMGKSAIYYAMAVGGTILLGLLALFLTLIVREAAIMLLVVLSPIAFALYCLPNTEKFFKKWWDFLIEMLMVYPIVVLVLSAADLLSISMNNFGGGADPATALIAFALQFAPLLAVPFAFKMASSTLGKLHGSLQGLANKGNEKIRKYAQRNKDEARQRNIQKRSSQYEKYKKNASKSKGFKRLLYGAAARGVGGYDIEEEMAKLNEASSKKVNETVSNGPDSEIRAITVNKKAAQAAMKKEKALAASRGEEVTQGDLWRQNEDGSIDYRTAGGAWVNEATVDRAQSRAKGNQSLQQAALTYEMTKVSDQADVERIKSSYPALARDAWGIKDPEQVNGVWKGAAFNNQNANREYKHYSIEEGEDKLTLNGESLFTEIDEKQGGYQMLQQNAATWRAMSSEVDKAKETLSDSSKSEKEKARAGRILARAESVAKATRASSGVYGSMPVGEGESAPQATPGMAMGREARAGAGAAGMPFQEINNFLTRFPETQPAQPAQQTPNDSGGGPGPGLL